MPPVTPADGPVAVTGAAGYIGSHIVLNLVKRGYTVRACVRDTTNLPKTAHLNAMNVVGPGSVTLHHGDLEIPGSYDAAFAGVSCVFHAAAEMGNLEGTSPEKVYFGGLEATKGVFASIRKAGTVRRIVYTSSFAAVGHPAAEGHEYTEDSWASMNQSKKMWNMEMVKKNRDIAYAMTKENTEKWVYAEAERMGIDAMGVCPCHVVGPLLCAKHQMPWAWQTRIGDMMSGVPHPRMFWNIVDVRDVAEAQVRIAECTTNKNGERYNLVATDDSGLIPQAEVQALLRKMYPGVGIGGDYTEGKVFRSPVCRLGKCVTQLGMKPRSVEEALRANADSLLQWGLVSPRKGVDNWQRKGKDLGLPKGGKWSPHVYPGLDPNDPRISQQMKDELLAMKKRAAAKL